ncbi:PE-PPE domain-containing protein [Gordonia sp. w5E2]|uniref:PE-PPE domain-containing protein n=2 Tax=Gordonia TaxID=2053 RepID=A0ABR5IAD9_9ACTN|nr:PE-PPE domain-containing protein [Gordonia jacobaea]KNA90649.1 hypothetical protein ABW18_13945 [Gordonia jacobaea]
MGGHFGFRRSIRAASTLGLAAVAAVLLAIGQTSGAGVARAEASADCGNGALVFVGGTWDPQAHLLDGVTRQPQYAGYTVERVEYPASIWPLGAFGFDDSQSQGVAATMSTVASYQAQCQGYPVVIVGYSQGAGIAGDVLTGIGTGNTSGHEISPSKVSGLLYSDPRQAGTLYGQGIERVLIGVIPGLTMAGGRGVDDFGGIPVTSVCFTGDPICDLPDPLHDPLGALDGFAGYWVKHGLYPLYMYLAATNGALWDAWGVKPLHCDNTTGQVSTCQLVVPSSAWVLTQQFVDKLGLGWTVPDLVSKRWRFPDILGITLADFQPPIRWAMGWFPQLPQLGYGGVLTDVYTFQDMARGLFTWDPVLWGQGVDALRTSVRSIAAMPLNFGKFWAYTLTGRDVTGIPGPAYRPSLVAFEEWLASLRSPSTTTSHTESLVALSASEKIAEASGTVVTEKNVGDHEGLGTTGAGVSTGDEGATGTEGPSGGKVVDDSASVGGDGAADGTGTGAGSTPPTVSDSPQPQPHPGGESSQPSENPGGAQAPAPESSAPQPTPDTSTPDKPTADTSTSDESTPGASTPHATSPESATPKPAAEGAPAA